MNVDKQVNVIDCNIGNLGSVINLIKKLNFEVNIVTKPGEFNSSRKIILPGVGHYDKCIQNLKRINLFNDLKNKIFSDNYFFLGICVGMQILFQSSEEGTEEGLGFFKGNVIKFNSNNNLKTPHMGWNNLSFNNKKFILNSDNRVYFCHSYYAQCQDSADIVASTIHGKKFPSIIGKKKIYGFQFHPEKSYKDGELLINHFLNL
jgi:glutamine amidotransferase